MGACVDKDKTDATPGNQQHSSCSQLDGDGHPDDEGAEIESQLVRLRHEIASLKAENRCLRERSAPTVSKQELSKQAPPLVGLSQQLSGPNGPDPPRLGKKVGFFPEATDAQEDPCSQGGGVPEGALDPQLLNSLLDSAWPFVSRWFEQMMRQDMEPAIQKVMPAGIQIQFGEDCHLGTTPMSMHDLQITSYMQPGSLEGEDIENVRIVGEVRYHGNCKVEVTMSVGKVMLTGLNISGAIVIELINLVPTPPFFCGIRLYFPNAPEVNVEVESEMLGLNMSFAFIQSKIAQALSGVIANAVVLPNRFAFSLGQALDPFHLRHPKPQGVLRVAILEARDLRDPGLRLKIDPFVMVNVGSTRWDTPSVKGTLNPCWDGDNVAIHDFFVMDVLAQVLRIEVRDGDYSLLGRKKSDFLGRVEVTVADVVDKQRGVIPCDRWLLLEGKDDCSEDCGEVRLQAQWRPLAHVKSLSSAPTVSQEEKSWNLGAKDSASWILFVGVYKAMMLPPAPDGTEHWVTISVAEPGGPKIVEVDTRTARSYAPVRKDIDALTRLGLSPAEMAGALQCDIGRVQTYLRRRSRISSPQNRFAVDVEWDAPILLPLESVHKMQLTATVWRQEAQDGGESPIRRRLFIARTSSITHVQLGYATYNLGELMECPRFATVQELPLEGCSRNKQSAMLKLRLQIRPLMPPPGADSSLAQRNRLRRKTLRGGLPEGPSRSSSAVARATCKEACLFTDFHTPDHSDSDSCLESSEPSEGEPVEGELMH